MGLAKMSIRQNDYFIESVYTKWQLDKMGLAKTGWAEMAIKPSGN